MSPDERGLLDALSSEMAIINHKIHLLHLQRWAIQERQRIAHVGILSGKRSKTGLEAPTQILAGIDVGLLLAAISGCAKAGHVISFSGTKRGNALVIGVYDGKDNDKVYPETIAEAEEVLLTILEAYDIVYTPDQSPPPSSEPLTPARARNKRSAT
jgi:hypothetical protein